MRLDLILLFFAEGFSSFVAFSKSWKQSNQSMNVSMNLNEFAYLSGFFLCFRKAHSADFLCDKTLYVEDLYSKGLFVQETLEGPPINLVSKRFQKQVFYPSLFVGLLAPVFAKNYLVIERNQFIK